jgi:hypothetical protein
MWQLEEGQRLRPCPVDAFHTPCRQRDGQRLAEASGIILALLSVLCTVGAGYFGWTMIQTDHVGVELTPEQERLERGGTSELPGRLGP